MPWCETCGEHAIWLDTHKCPPIWLVCVQEDSPGDAYEIYARYPEDAATKAVEKWEQGGADYSIGSGHDDVTVWVRPDGDMSAPAQLFEVHGEMLPHYYANKAPTDTPLREG